MDDFSLVDAETVVTRRGHAGCAADGAIDVGNGTAGAADVVVVVVSYAGLVSRHRAGGLDVPHESGVAERPKSVVDGLVGDLAEVVPDGADYRVGVGVGVRVSVDVGVLECVAVGVNVLVGVGVGVWVIVLVGVAVDDWVIVGVNVRVSVGLLVAVLVAVRVAVVVRVGVRVLVGVRVGALVAIRLEVAVAVTRLVADGVMDANGGIIGVTCVGMPVRVVDGITMDAVGVIPIRAVAVGMGVCSPSSKSFMRVAIPTLGVG